MSDKYAWLLEHKSKIYWDVRDSIHREDNVQKLGEILDKLSDDLIDLMDKDEQDEHWDKLDDGQKYKMPDNYGVDQGGAYEK